MRTPKALDRTADRRRSTGELHQALAPLLPDDDSVLLIPAARREEQARLEAEIFLGSARLAACPRTRSVSSACAQRLTGSPSG